MLETSTWVVLVALSAGTIGCGASFEAESAGGSGGSGGSASNVGGATSSPSAGGGGLDQTCDNFALKFDGVDDTVVIPLGTVVDVGSYTIEMWIKSASPYVDGERRLYTYGAHNESGVALLLSQEQTILGHFEARVYDPGEQELVGNRAPLDTWQHVAMVVGSNQLRIYQDGQQVSARSVNAAVSPMATDEVIIGGSTAGGDQHQMRGMIDEVRVSAGAVYDSQFTPARRLGAAGTMGFQFRFDEGEGDVVIDDVSGLEGMLRGSSGSGNGPEFVPAPCE